MSVEGLAPGVYVRVAERPAFPQDIPTSIVGFIGRTETGMPNKAIKIRNFLEFLKLFGNPSDENYMGYAVQQYFVNATVGGNGAAGGNIAAIIVSIDDGKSNAVYMRIMQANGHKVNDYANPNDLSPTDSSLRFQLKAISPGNPGKNYAVLIERHPTSSNLFNLFVIKNPYDLVTTIIGQQSTDNTDKVLRILNQWKKDATIESFQGLSYDKNNSSFMNTILQNQSNYIVRNDNNNTEVPDEKIPSIDSILGLYVCRNLQDPTTSPDLAGSFDGKETDVNLEKVIPTQAENISAKKGIYAFDELPDKINILCMPPMAVDPDTKEKIDIPLSWFKDAKSYCDAKPHNPLLIIDPPKEWTSASRAINGLGPYQSLRGSNTVLCFPRIRGGKDGTSDFLNSAFYAGNLANFDNRIGGGPWIPAAGMSAEIVSADGFDLSLTVNLTPDEHGELNSLGVNCLIDHGSVYGITIMGARTLGYTMDDQDKYVTQFRTRQYVSNLCYLNLKRFLFKNNDERLWQNMSSFLGSIMKDLDDRGAFEKDAKLPPYIIKCDGETNPPEEQAKGVCNVILAIRLAFPVEFIFVYIKQLVGPTLV